MKKIIIPQSHHSFTSAQSINEICQPLFNHSGITHFLYGRVHSNGEVVGLTTHPQWHQNHLQQGHLISPPIPNLKNQPSEFYFILTENVAGKKFNPALYEMKNFFKLDFPIFFIEKGQNFYEIFIFFTNYGNAKILNFYLNNIQMLKLL